MLAELARYLLVLQDDVAFDGFDCLVALEPFPQALEVDSADCPGAAARADHWIEVWVRRRKVLHVAVEADAANELIRVLTLGEGRSFIDKTVFILDVGKHLFATGLEHDVHLGVSVGHR